MYHRIKNLKALWSCSPCHLSDLVLSTQPMKLHFHPVSTTSRPIMMLAADDGISLDYEIVDLFTGAHL